VIWRWDWNRRTCARHGHITYAPDEGYLRQRLHVPTPAGEAWRCLRCGDYTIGAPHGSGPADEAPLVHRGRALRDIFILRFLAVERAARGVLVLLAAYAVWRFKNSQASLRQVFEEDLPLLRPLADKLGYDLDNSPVVHTIRNAFSLEESTLTWVAAGLVAYAVIELAEGVGLWYIKRWAEYLTVVATAGFLPLEVYEIVERVTWLRVGALVFNVAAVVYLLLAKRLFGLRGGAAAVEHERHSESLIEVERAAVAGAGGPGTSVAAPARNAREDVRPAGLPRSPGSP
jgi:uncharacterized membrane protein (DUF2068 family)